MENENNKNDSYSVEIVVSTTAVALITVLLKFLGYAEKKVLAYYFGTQDELEAFFVALRISLFAYFLFRGIIRPALLPLLISSKNQSSLKARNFGLSVSLVTASIFALIVALGIIFAPLLVNLFAAGFSTQKQQLCVYLTRRLFPALILLNLAYLLYVSLHTRKKFAIAAWGECLQKVVFIVFIVLLVIPYGFNLIVISFLISAASLLIFYMVSQARALTTISGAFQYTGDMMKYLALLAWPILIGSLFSQIGQLYQTRIASHMIGGSIAALDFSRKIIDLPLILVPMTLSLVVFPYFSELADKKEIKRSYKYLSQSIRALMLLFIPLSIFVFLYREQIVMILFAGGAFDKDSISLTAVALSGYAPGLSFFAIEMILTAYFFAHKRVLVAIFCGIVATSVGILSLPLLAKHFSLSGVSGYLTLTRGVKIILLVYFLKHLNINVPWKRAIMFLLKQLIAVFATMVICFLLKALFPPALSLLSHSQLLSFAAETSLLVLIYALCLYLLRFPEFRRIQEAVKRILAHRKPN